MAEIWQCFQKDVYSYELNNIENALHLVRIYISYPTSHGLENEPQAEKFARRVRLIEIILGRKFRTYWA